MQIYLDIVRFSFLKFFTYPYEIISQVAKRLIELLFLIFFWSLVVKGAGGTLGLTQLISYFLIAMGVGDLAMTRWGPFGSTIGNMVKSGQISNYMIKPTGLVATLYAVSVGRNGLRLMLALINVTVGLIILPPAAPISILLFFCFFATAFLIGFAYNIFEGVLFLNFTDASGIRNSIQNLIMVFTGAFVPIYLFPSPLKEIVKLTPFPSMAFGPTNALQTSQVTNEVIKDFGVSLFWAILLNLIMYKLWRSSIKKYEAVGI